MSEIVSSAADGAVAAPSGPSAGTLLRQVREAAGLPVDVLATVMKVPVKKLEALESDHWELLPDAVFARGLAASICRTLKADPEPILARMPGAQPRLAASDAGINAPYRGPGDGAGPTVWSYLSRPVVLAVLALLLGALVLILLPTVQPFQSRSAATTEAARANAPAVPAAPPASTGMVSESALPAAAVSSSPAAPLVTTTTPGAAVAPPVSPASAASPAGLPVQAPATNSANEMIVFTTSAPTWISVSDAAGKPVLRKMLNAGESAGVSGAPPLSVVVGRADATRVQVRGADFELGPLTRDNVARFEVK